MKKLTKKETFPEGGNQKKRYFNHSPLTFVGSIKHFYKLIEIAEFFKCGAHNRTIVNLKHLNRLKKRERKAMEGSPLQV